MGKLGIDGKFVALCYDFILGLLYQNFERTQTQTMQVTNGVVKTYAKSGHHILGGHFRI